jgi:hypothetical protein
VVWTGLVWFRVGSCEHGSELSGSILWRIDPLLGKDLETNNETTTVAMQRYSKNSSKTIEVFSAWSVPRSYLENVGYPSRVYN